MEIKFEMTIVREVTINISAKDLDNLTSVLVQLQEHGAEKVRSLNAAQIDKLHFGEALEKQEAFVIPHGSSSVKLEHLVPALLAKLQSADKREQPIRSRKVYLRLILRTDQASNSYTQRLNR